MLINTYQILLRAARVFYICLSKWDLKTLNMENVRMNENIENTKLQSSETREIKISNRSTNNNFKRLLKELENEYNNVNKENFKLKSDIVTLTAKLNALNQENEHKHQEIDNVVPSFSKKVGAFLDGASTKFKITKQKSQKIDNSLTFHTLTGHTDAVVDVVCSTKASIVSSCSIDGTCKIWSSESCCNIFTYEGHQGAVNCSRLNPIDPVIVCSASGDRTIHIWSFISAIDYTAKLSSEKIGSQKLNSEESIQNEKSENSSQEMIRLSTPLAELKGHNGPVSSVDWIYDGKSIVSSSWDRTLMVWDIEKNVAISTLNGHEAAILYVKCHPSQKTLVSSSADSTFRLWDIRHSNKPSVTVNNCHSSDVTCAIFFGNNNILTNSYDKYAKVWDMKNMREPIMVCKTSAEINRSSVSFSSYICLPLKNKHFKIWDISKKSSNSIFTQREGHTKSIEACCWEENNQNQITSLFTCSLDSTIIKWAIEGNLNQKNSNKIV